MRSVKIYQHPDVFLNKSDIGNVIFVYTYEEADLIISSQYDRSIELYLSTHLDVIAIELGSFHYKQLVAKDKPELLEKISNIYPYIVNKNELETSIINNARQQPLLSLLLYAWMRHKLIKPIFSYKMKQGYYYPLSIEDEELQLMLDELVRLQCLESEVLEVGYQCEKCQNIHLLIRDCCEYCHSIAIKDVAMIHHFPCSYVGREDLFDKGFGIYKCPKCHKELKQIGLDYDKPGTLVFCDACQKDSTESVVGCHCLSCDSQFLIDEAIHVNIHQYKLTAQGINALLSGKIINIGLKEYIAGEIELDIPEIFYAMVKRMVALKRREVFESYVLVIDLSGLEFEDTYREKISLYKTLTHELKVTLRDTDCFMIEDDTIYILLCNIPQQNVVFAVKRFKNSLDAILSQRLSEQVEIRELDVEVFYKAGEHNG